jgi:SOS-response transcriptional repressor LexA
MEKINFMENLRAARLLRKLTQKQLADHIGMSRDTIIAWESGKVSPTLYQIENLAMALDVYPSFLLGLESASFELMKDYLRETGADEVPITLNDIAALVDSETDSPDLGKKSVPEADPVSRKDDRVDLNDIKVIRNWVKVPVLDIGACAGLGWSHDFANVQIESYEDLPDFMVGSVDEERPPFMMRVAGDSMTDANLRDGDYAIVNPAEGVHSGDAALCQYGEFRDMVFKRVYFLPNGTVELRSANSEANYPVIRYEKDSEAWEYAPLTIIGKVVGFWGKPKRG